MILNGNTGEIEEVDDIDLVDSNLTLWTFGINQILLQWPSMDHGPG